MLFSDECSLERGTGSARLWVFRKPDEKEGSSDMVDEVKREKTYHICSRLQFGLMVSVRNWLRPNFPAI